jgi:hypothetical protein
METCGSLSTALASEWPDIKTGTSVSIRGYANFPRNLKIELRKIVDGFACDLLSDTENAETYQVDFYRPKSFIDDSTTHLIIDVSCWQEIGSNWIFELHGDNLRQLSFAYGSFSAKENLIGFRVVTVFGRVSVDPLTGRLKTLERTHTCDGDCYDHEHIYEIDNYDHKYNLVQINLVHTDRGFQRVLYKVMGK